MFHILSLQLTGVAVLFLLLAVPYTLALLFMPRCGRGHDAYSNRGVSHSVIHSFSQSVATISRSSRKTNR